MGKYILIMNSGYEQMVESDETLMLKWKHVCSVSISSNSDRTYNFNNGLMVNLSEVAMIKPYECIGSFPPPPPPPNGLTPRIVTEGFFSGLKLRKEGGF